MTKNEVKITVEEANEEFLLPLKGLLTWRCGSAGFKSKVAKLEREVRRAANAELGLLTTTEEKLIRLINVERNRAQKAKEQFVPTDQIFDLQDDVATLKKEAYAKVLTIKSEPIVVSDLPLSEDIDKEQSYNYTFTNNEGQRENKQFSPNTLIGILSGVFIID